MVSLKHLTGTLIFIGVSAIAIIVSTKHFQLHEKLGFLRDYIHFPVQNVLLNDDAYNPRVTENDIHNALHNEISQGFFFMNIKTIQDTIARLPWVQSVLVKRVWPDKLEVTLKEQTPLARWYDSDLKQMGIISTEGDVFFPPHSTIPAGLPKLYGPITAAKEMLDEYFTVLELLSPLGLKVSELQLSEAGGLKIMLDNGIQIILGKTGQDNQLARFVYVYQGTISPQLEKIAYVDMRYHNGIAIGWKASKETMSKETMESIGAKASEATASEATESIER